MRFLFCLLVLCLSKNAFSQDLQLHQALQFGAGSDDGISNLIIDGQDHVFIAGRYSNVVDFDPGVGITTLPSAFNDGFLAKYDSNNQLIWVREFASTNSIGIGSIILDADGSIYLTGGFSGTADFIPGSGVFNLTTPSTYFDAFVAKLDSAGNFLWVKRFGGAGSETISNAFLNPGGNLILFGGFFGMTDFDPGSGVTSHTSVDPLIYDDYMLTLDHDGNFISVKPFPVPGLPQLFNIDDIEMDSAGNFYLGGRFNGTIDFDFGPEVSNLTASPLGGDLFLLKLEPDGEFDWAKVLGCETSGDGFGALAIDHQDNVILCGYYFGTINADVGNTNTTFTSNGVSDMMLIKYDTNGIFILGRSIGGDFQEWPRAVIADADRIFVSGSFTGTCTFEIDGQTVTISGPAPGDEDIMLFGFDNEGNIELAKSFTGPNDQTTGLLAKNSQESIYLAGTFRDTIDFDCGEGLFEMSPNGTLGASDIFLVKLSPAELGSISTSFETPIIIPNPSTGWFMLSGYEDFIGGICSVFSLDGKKINQFALTAFSINHQLPSGLYMLVFEKENQREICKLIVK